MRHATGTVWHHHSKLNICKCFWSVLQNRFYTRQPSCPFSAESRPLETWVRAGTRNAHRPKGCWPGPETTMEQLSPAGLRRKAKGSWLTASQTSPSERAMNDQGMNTFPVDQPLTRVLWLAQTSPQILTWLIYNILQKQNKPTNSIWNMPKSTN